MYLTALPLWKTNLFLYFPNEKKFFLQNNLRPISEEFAMTNPNPQNLILRRKSTGSFDASKGSSKQTMRPTKNNSTTASS